MSKKYIYRNQEVAIINSDNLDGRKELASAGNQSLILASEVKPEEETYLALSDAYSGESGEEIVDAEVVNPENSQALINAFEIKDMAEADEFERQFNVVTNQYYDWESEAKKMVDRINQEKELASEFDRDENFLNLKKEWEKLTANAPSVSCEHLSFEELMKVAD